MRSKLVYSVLFLSASIAARAQQQVHPNPDCQFFFTLSASTPALPTGNGFDNRQQGCTTWNFSYANGGLTGLTITLETSPSTAGGVANSFSAGFVVQQATISGSNANSNTTGGFWWARGTAPFVRVKLTGITGSGTVNGAVFGWRKPNAGGSGGSGITCLIGDVVAGSGSGCTTATVEGIETVPFCAGYAPTNGQFVQYTTGGSPSPCYGAATGGSGGNGTGTAVYSGLAGIALSDATVYFPVGGGSLASSTEASVNTLQGSAGGVSGFGVNLSAALGTTVASNNVVVLTWRKNGSNQAVTCTITNPATTCSDTTHSFVFSAGDALDIQAVFTGTITATPVWVMNAGISSGASSAAYILLEEHTASASATLDFTTCISTTYDDYEIRVTGLQPATDNVTIQVRFSTDGGSTYVATGYQWSLYAAVFGGAGAHGSGSDTSIGVGVNQTNTAATPMNGTWQLSNPLGGTDKFIGGRSSGFDIADTAPFVDIFTGFLGSTTAVNAFRVLASTGNLTAGTIRCYGIAK